MDFELNTSVLQKMSVLEERRYVRMCIDITPCGAKEPGKHDNIGMEVANKILINIPTARITKISDGIINATIGNISIETATIYRSEIESILKKFM